MSLDRDDVIVISATGRISIRPAYRIHFDAPVVGVLIQFEARK